MYVTQEDIDAMKRALGLLPKDPAHPAFNVRPISEAWRWRDRRPGYRTATANVAYIWRRDDVEDRFGSMPPRFADRRSELQASGLSLPSSAPKWARQDFAIWQEADEIVDRRDDVTMVRAWHVVMEIPAAVAATNWKTLVSTFIDRELVVRGAVVAWAIHGEGDGARSLKNVHAHLIVTALRWRHDHRHGQRHSVWSGSWGRQTSLEMAWRRACSSTQLLGLLPNPRLKEISARK
jgi:hypothetical protein